MLTKLTLTIDQDVIVKAKTYAQKKQRSVSKLVEDYLLTITGSDAVVSENSSFEGKLTNSITGMFKDYYDNEDYDALLENAILEKNK